MQDVTKDREKYIGGSDIPIIMGLSPFRTRWELLQFKAGIAQPDFNGNTYTVYGNSMEPKIRDYVNSVMHADFKESKLIIDDLRYHADGYDVRTNRVLEIKTTSRIKDALGDYKSYLVQVLTGMAMYKAQEGVLAVYERPADFSEDFDPYRLKIYEVHMAEWEDLMAEVDEAVFSFRADLYKLRENPNLTEEDFLPLQVVACAKVVTNLESYLSNLKAAEAELKDAKAKLKALMEQYGIKSWTTPDNIKITLVPRGKDKTVPVFDEVRFLEENPELGAKYMVNKTSKGKAGYVRITLP